LPCGRLSSLPSAFYCTLGLHTIVSYRITNYDCVCLWAFVTSMTTITLTVIADDDNIILSSDDIDNCNNWSRQWQLDCVHRAQTSAKASNLNQKVIRDLNPDFRINLDSDPYICRIAPKMLRIRYLVSVSNFAECSENWPVTV